MQSLNFANMRWANKRWAYMRWYFSQMIKKFGILGMIALAITLGCCLFYAINVIPLKQKIAAATNRLQQVNQQQVLSNETEKSQLNIASKQTTTKTINRFYAQFPASESLPNWLRLIDKIALKQNLTLNSGDYKLTQIKQLQINQGALARYEIVLPVTGNYVQIRHFVSQVLHELPALALTDMRLSRESAQSPTLDARLTFLLLLKSNSANKTSGIAWQ